MMAWVLRENIPMSNIQFDAAGDWAKSSLSICIWKMINPSIRGGVFDCMKNEAQRYVRRRGTLVLRFFSDDSGVEQCEQALSKSVRTTLLLLTRV